MEDKEIKPTPERNPAQAELTTTEMAAPSSTTNQVLIVNITLGLFRVEICRDRHDRRSCKICASCVNFPGKQRDFSHNLRRITKFTHTKRDFALKLLKVYTLSFTFSKNIYSHFLIKQKTINSYFNLILFYDRPHHTEKDFI